MHKKGVKVKHVHKISVKITKNLTAVPSHIHKPQQMAALHVHTWWREDFSTAIRVSVCYTEPLVLRVTHAL